MKVANMTIVYMLSALITLVVENSLKSLGESISLLFNSNVDKSQFIFLVRYYSYGT